MHLIDTHFHLDYYKNHEYWYDQINKLQQYTLCVTNSPEVFHSCRKLYPETKYVKFALGYNPQQSLKVDFSKSTFLHELSTTQYVGEVGLDYSKNFVQKKKSSKMLLSLSVIKLLSKKNFLVFILGWPKRIRLRFCSVKE